VVVEQRSHIVLEVGVVVVVAAQSGSGLVASLAGDEKGHSSPIVQ